MIKKITAHKLDQTKNVSRKKSNTNNKNSTIDYSNAIVTKPWGYEFLVFENDYVAIWMLHIVRKKKTSLHCHPRKITSLILLSGEASFYHIDDTVELSEMDGLVIDKGVFHSTEASSPYSINPPSENGIWVLEIESPPIKTDLVRMKDNYGRVGESYEGRKNMVFDPSEIFKLSSPKINEQIKTYFQNRVFTMKKGGWQDPNDLPNQEALICLIGQNDLKPTDDFPFKLGEVCLFSEFWEKVKHKNLESFTFLIIERAKAMKVSDYIFKKIAETGTSNVFLVSGGSAMHLLDSLGKNKDLTYVSNHHEQAVTMAAEGYARISGKPGAALVTCGPGGTNAVTGVCGAWVDSIPVIIISGQAVSHNLSQGTNLRQFGIQELDIVKLVEPITKYAVCVTDYNQIRFHIEKALYLATNGRPGPVWLDIPLDIQSKLINPDMLPTFIPDKVASKTESEGLSSKVNSCIDLLHDSKRPVLIVGYGVRLSSAEEEISKLIQTLNIPVIFSWNAFDLIPSDHPLAIGRCGIFGDRASNFAVQNSDFLLSVGCRLSVAQIGYNHKQFAREAKKVIVDIDEVEIKKSSLKADIPIQADAKIFINEMLRQINNDCLVEKDKWRERCQMWKAKYPVILPEYKKNKEMVNSFHFVGELAKKLDKNAVIVTDMGTSFTCTMQAFKTKHGQRIFTSSGMSAMGFGLPGAIGACIAHDRKQTICISGDGSLQMNIQELQTMVHYKLPIKLFVLNNHGYLAIKNTQQNHFGRFVGANSESGVSCPELMKVAKAYGLHAVKIEKQDELNAKLDIILTTSGPSMVEVMMPENQPLIPRISSLKKPDGSVVSKPIEDLFPFLDREEFAKNMIIETTETLK